MERFETSPLGLRLGEVVGVGEGQADVRGHVLQQFDVPIVECALPVRLEGEHRGDPLAAQHRHPDKGARHPSPVRWRTRDEHRSPLAHGPDLALELLALEAARPWRLAHQHRLARLVRLARRAGDRQGDRRHNLLHPSDVLIALRDRPFVGLGDGGQDEAVELEVCGKLLTQCAHDRPAVQA